MNMAPPPESENPALPMRVTCAPVNHRVTPAADIWSGWLICVKLQDRDRPAPDIDHAWCPVQRVEYISLRDALRRRQKAKVLITEFGRVILRPGSTLSAVPPR